MSGVQRIDPDLMREMIKHSAGRGVAPVPTSGAGLKGNRIQYHAMLPLHHETKAKKFSKDIKDELAQKVMEI